MRLEGQRKDTGGGAVVGYCFEKIQISTEFILQITPKFSKEVENLQK